MAVPLKLSLSNRMSGHGVDVNQSTNSAQLAKAEREIKQLQQENAILKKNFDEISSLYTQLIAESSHENYEEWRVMLLKSQIIQLERQILLLTDALSRRSTIILDVENSLAAAGDLCRNFFMQAEKMPSIKLTRSDLERLTNAIESSRMKLFSNAELTSVDNVKQPLQTMNPFIKNQRSNDAVSLLDICTGHTDHINIKRVSQLETNLMALYKQLKLVANSLGILASACDAPKTVYVRLAGQVAKACNMLHKTNQKLLQLSVLVPAAPLIAVLVLSAQLNNGQLSVVCAAMHQKPAQWDSVMKQLNAEDVLNAFQKNTKKPINQKDMKYLVDALLKAMNYSLIMANAEKDLLLDELKFHQDVYALQSDSVASLLASIKEEYFRFESDLQATICKPFKEILTSFESLKDSTSDKSIEVFFRVFRSHAHQITETLNAFSAVDNKCIQEKEELLSQYGKAFSENLFLAKVRCEQERDQRLSEFESLKAEEADHLLELRKLFPTTGSDMTTNSDLTTNSTYCGDGCWQDVRNFAVNKSELPRYTRGDESCKTDGAVQKQNRLDTKLVRKRQTSFPNLTDLGMCTCSSDTAVKQISDQQPERLSKPALSRNDLTPDALIAAKAEKKNRGTFKRKEPLVALSKLRLKQPVGCNFPGEQSSSADSLTRINRVSSSRPSSCHLTENSPG